MTDQIDGSRRGNPPVMGTCSRELSNVMVVAAEGTAAVSASFHGPQEETLENRQFSLRN